MVEVITVKNNHVDHYKTVIMRYQVLCKNKVCCVMQCLDMLRYNILC